MERTKKYKLLYKIKNSLNCRWKDLIKLSDEQADYINHYLDHSSFLEACPGGGKTEVIGIKSAFEMQKWKLKNSGIAVVTFTASAAKEIDQRIRKYGSVSSGLFPHFVGTFDSWIHNYILQPFSHYMTKYVGKDGDKSVRLVDVDSSAGFLFNYSTNISKNGRLIPVSVTDYYYDYNNTLKGHNDITDGLLNSGISNAERTSLLQKKKAFITAGFATYADVEWVCNLLLDKYPVLAEKLSKRFPIIMVDECQDLSRGQINLLERLRSQGTSLHFVGDLNQSIYEFREVSPQEITNYIQNNNFIHKRLSNNYRSCQPIVDVFEQIIGNTVPVVGHENTVYAQSCILWQYTDQTFSQLPERFKQFIEANGLDGKKSAILARGKTTISPLRTQMDKYSFTKTELFAIAIHNWLKPNRNTEDINNALFYLGRAICLLAYGGRGDARNQYCPENMESVEWRLFLKQILETATSIYPYEANGQDLSWTNWTPKLKAFLQPKWQTLSGNIPVWANVVTKLRAPNGRGNSPVKEVCTRTGNVNSFRTTTIHSVKGETLSAVLLISHHNRQSQGGHFSHWLRVGNFNPEHIRFAYVACSRPKYALIVATPQLQAGDLQQLQNLGLVYQPQE
jgi:DNA helicase-2/ATP-dependent DNA helicase PcrA